MSLIVSWFRILSKLLRIFSLTVINQIFLSIPILYYLGFVINIQPHHKNHHNHSSLKYKTFQPPETLPQCKPVNEIKIYIVIKIINLYLYLFYSVRVTESISIILDWILLKNTSIFKGISELVNDLDIYLLQIGCKYSSKP